MRFYIESKEVDFKDEAQHIKDILFEGNNILVEPTNKLRSLGGKFLIYVESGSLTCMIKEKLFIVANSQYGVVELEYGESIRLSLIGDSNTKISIYEFYDKLVVDDIKSDKFSASDIKYAFKVALTDFRGSKFIFRSLKNCWYDQYLQKAIKKVNSLFISFSIWVLVSTIITVLLQNFSHLDLALLCLFIWTMLHLFIVRPILYLIFLPKPISDHIKSIDELTSEELDIKKTLEKENDRTDKLLKKYRITGRNKYID